MDRKNKRKIFELLAGSFETDDFREYYLDMCEEIPDYIFTMPASTSGKYHNAEQCQQFGQLYHIFMFHSILEHLLRLEGNQKIYNTPQIRDAMRCVPAFHDAVKCGWNGSLHTVQNHPILAAEWVLNTDVPHKIGEAYRKGIADMCEAHSGQWNTNRSGVEIMPKPRNDAEMLIHECDILASRPDLNWVITPELKALLGDSDATGVEPVTAENLVLTFGKHKGETLAAVFAAAPDYVEWLAENFDREPVRGLAKGLVGK